jgi:hypothetical protein
MHCKSCESDTLRHFSAEINIHFQRLETPTVLAFPQLIVCLKCGHTELVLAESVVRTLKETISSETSRSA